MLLIYLQNSAYSRLSYSTLSSKSAQFQASQAVNSFKLLTTSFLNSFKALTIYPMIPQSEKFQFEARLIRALIMGAKLLLDLILPSIFLRELQNFLIQTNEGLVRVARRARASSTEAVAAFNSSTQSSQSACSYSLSKVASLRAYLLAAQYSQT